MAKSFQRFTLHVQLQHIDPPIWRRIEVEGTESLRKLHHILQAAFGWEDTHLHDFLIDGMAYAMFEVDDVLDFADPGTSADDQKVRLQKVLNLARVSSTGTTSETAGITPSSLRKWKPLRANRGARPRSLMVLARARQRMLAARMATKRS